MPFTERATARAARLERDGRVVRLTGEEGVRRNQIGRLPGRAACR